ncbi:hypothetical protein BZA05DRAFT_128109 [Tricharina praecox]|uniref:uncharacterized protein n=1 Tax=Tricharina praecox TaxID=43433 RepID=UPI002220987E|nr:uncharacterized protein BZA05DRAFT_128109 [Tricharina praecox]KAI5846824.1 hypothetical protein BZA05DRAFT_128109 [Tricharina praecox]
MPSPVRVQYNRQEAASPPHCTLCTSTYNSCNNPAAGGTQDHSRLGDNDPHAREWGGGAGRLYDRYSIYPTPAQHVPGREQKTCPRSFDLPRHEQLRLASKTAHFGGQPSGLQYGLMDCVCESLRIAPHWLVGQHCRGHTHRTGMYLLVSFFPQRIRIIFGRRRRSLWLLLPIAYLPARSFGCCCPQACTADTAVDMCQSAAGSHSTR